MILIGSQQASDLVELRGFEPLTSCMPLSCTMADKGHCRRSESFGGHIGSVPYAAVAALLHLQGLVLKSGVIPGLLGAVMRFIPFVR